MYNEITRKLTSLTLMTVMIAGGLTFAIPGMEPAYADGDLSLSAQEVGNFAGIQVMEIVVNDPDRSSTDESEGRPNVELNGDDVFMAQGDDGAWYAYVANNLAIATFNGTSGLDINDIYRATTGGVPPSGLGTDAVYMYNGTGVFLEGFKSLQSNPTVNNNVGVNETASWPFIQTYDISDNTQVTVQYGTGGTAETVNVTYDYDDSKDLSMDRNRYPASGLVMLSIDDSLLNLSPTAEDYWGFNSTDIFYFLDADTTLATAVNIPTWENVGFEEGPLTYDVGSSNIFSIQNTTVHDDIREVYPGQEGLVIITESTQDDNIFVNYDDSDLSNIIANSDDGVTGSGVIGYNDNHSVILDTFDAIINFAHLASDWLSGVEIDVELTDEDKNLNSMIDEDLLILEGEVPYISIGNPLTIDELAISNGTQSMSIDSDSLTASKTASISIPNSTSTVFVNATWPTDYQGGSHPTNHINHPHIFPYISFDFSSLGGESGTFYVGNATGISPVDNSVITVPGITFHGNSTHANFEVDITDVTLNAVEPSGTVYFDLLFFGQVGHLVADDPFTGDIEDGATRVNDAFYRFQLEETDDNTAKFEGTLEYIMINQINVFDTDTYDDIETADDSVVIIVNDDLDDEDSVRINYNDIDSTGSDETISVQEDANTYSGTISLDSENYSAGNTVTVQLLDADLNTDSDTIEIYTSDPTNGWIGNDEVWVVQMLIDDTPFNGNCNSDLSLDGVNFSLIETSKGSGLFEGTLKLPLEYCSDSTTVSSTNGLDMEFEYQDYSDASGEPNETSTSVSVQSNTGSVTLDRTVYPVPVGFEQFALHEPATGFLDATPVNVVIRVNDPDANVSSNGEDSMSTDVLELEIARGSISQTLIINSTTLVETAPDSGIFEVDVEISQQAFENFPDGIEQGDIIKVEYTDEADASGSENSVTDSGTFDLRNGVIQTDKSVYLIGGDAIITMIEPDLDLDSESAETLSLDLINWDSDAGDINLSDDVFDAEPFGLRETGDNTGIFQVVIEIPREINGDKLERGEQIELEYTDHGPAGADFVGHDDEDITLDIFTSNFGATVELDQKVYTWTDKVYITIVAPDHNFDDNSIDEIGVDPDAEISVSTRGDEIENYKLVETGTDTGIFTGEVILTGFESHDADGNGVDGDATGFTSEDNSGPTNGFLASDNDDGLTVSFEFSDGDTATGSSLIRWNIGETQWLEASYPATGTGIVRIIDPDMNLNPESVDTFDVNVWSDTAAGGIALAVTETNEATGIFEGTVFFTVTDSSSGSRLQVSEGDTITAEYEDNTLPDPYSRADELEITATATIGTIVPPLERAPAANLRTVDSFNNSLDTVRVDQQVQITAELRNGQDREQAFAYLVQIQNEDGVTVSLAWITGSLTSDQDFSPALSWIPQQVGTYTATGFVWESVDNPTALSPPVTTTIHVTS